MTSPTVAATDTAATPLFLTSATRPPSDRDPVVVAVERQAAAALTAVRETDPEAWLFLERSRYLAEGSCDPYAELMLRRAGFLPGTGLLVQQ